MKYHNAKLTLKVMFVTEKLTNIAFFLFGTAIFIIIWHFRTKYFIVCERDL